MGIIMKLLSGKKSYAVGAGMIVYAGIGYGLKFLTAAEAGQIAMQGAGILALRAGITKSGPTATNSR